MVGLAKEARARHGTLAASLTQERIVFGLTIVALAVFSLLLPGFFSRQNLLNLARNVSVLGIVATGLAIVVIGRGIDLSGTAIMAVGAAWAVTLSAGGTPETLALLLGLGLVVLMGVANGLLVAFIEIPPIFVTLATGLLIFGIGQFVLIRTLIVHLPASASFMPLLGQSKIAGVPIQILVAAVVMILAHLFLKYLRWGRFTFAQGDNIETARLTGIKVRPLLVGQYVLAAVIAYVGGILLAGANPTFSISVASAGMMYDVILVVVLGGVSLGGGSGGMSSVLAGTLLIGTLINGMTIMDVSEQWQSLVKGFVLLLAIVLDSALHPRDEETTRQNDI